jgi:hypothetical protein
MQRHVALLAAAAIAVVGLAGCGGGGGNPGACAGSFEVCSEDRSPGDVVITTTGVGTVGIPTDAPTTPITTDAADTSTIPVNATGR